MTRLDDSAKRSGRRVTALRAEELWAEKLQSIPSLFARIIYMSRLRGEKGRYHEPELKSITSPSICHRIIQSAHLASFRTWLGFGLRAKVADLRPYIASLGFRGSAFHNRRSWIIVAREATPGGASQNEVQLFLKTVEAVVLLLEEMEH